MSEPRSFTLRVTRGCRAFTIVELLVAIGVTAILVTLMLSVTINVLKGWNQSSGKLSNENQARLVLEYLSKDLQGAILRRDTGTWLAATIQDEQTGTGDTGMSGSRFTADWSGTVKPTAINGSFAINPAERLLKNYKFGQAGVWLRFFTIPPDNVPGAISNTSAPRAVGYQMTRVRVKGSDQYVYALFRSEVRPGGTASGSTFSLGYDLFQDKDDDPSYNLGNMATVGNPGTIRRPHFSQIIANNVIDFGVRLYGRDSGAEVEIFPVRRDGVGAALGLPATGVPLTYAASLRDPSTAPDVDAIGNASDIIYGDDTTASGHNPIYPTAAEVLVRILTPEGARLIAALEAGQLGNPDGLTTDEHWWKIAEEHSDVFTRRIEILSRAF